VVRAWTEYTRGDQIRPIVVFSSLYYDLKKGCRQVQVVQPVPETLPPGRYFYDVGVRSCNAINRCVTRRLDSVPTTVVGGMWPDVDVPLPPPMHPSQSTYSVPGFSPSVSAR
jgi:hypothetical protein